MSTLTLYCGSEIFSEIDRSVFCVNGYLSEVVALNSGAPQGCVLLPMLFSIYTNHMNLQTAVTCLFKFADDMALVGMLLNEDTLATYFFTCFALE